MNQLFERAGPQDILRWAFTTFEPNVAASSSFQPQSLPLLHMISQETPRLPVLFLDTGFHFQETLAFRDRLEAEWNLELKILRPQIGLAGFKKQHGELYYRDPDLCCYINKVEPMELARKGLRAWISGIRRDQTPHRKATPIVSRLPDGVYKVCPIAMWTRREIQEYARRHQLPEHPLQAQGYSSIGCMPCTRPSTGAHDERSGRWAGTEKTECGLHLEPDLKAVK